jgi:hypothetical protein
MNEKVDSIALVKSFLKEELENKDIIKDSLRSDLFTSVIPILHNENLIYLQFNGWSINLLSDGTWFWEDTTGG